MTLAKPSFWPWMLGALGLALVSAGCIGIKTGSTNRIISTVATGRTNLLSVAELRCTTTHEDDHLRVALYGRCSLRHEEIDLVTTEPGTKKVYIGLFPYVGRLVHDDRSSAPDRVASLIFEPPFAVAANLFFLLYPTISSILISPFAGYHDSGDGRTIDAAGMIGVYKYRIDFRQTTTPTVRSSVQVDDEWRPLSGVHVDCRFEDSGYRAAAMTDAKGVATFMVPPDVVRQSASITVKNVTQSPYRDVLGRFVGQQTNVVVARKSEVSPVTIPQKTTLAARSWSREAVALADVSFSGVSKNDADVLTQWFFNALIESDYYQMLSRQDAKAVLFEQAFQRSDNCDDTTCLVEMGKLLAVRRIIGGNIGSMEDVVVFSVRMVDVETGAVVVSARGSSSPQKKAMLDLVAEVARSLCLDYARLMSTSVETRP